MSYNKKKSFILDAVELAAPIHSKHPAYGKNCCTEIWFIADACEKNSD
jgi:hypothetical protein